MNFKHIMQKFIRPLLFWTLILCACSTSLPGTDAPSLDPASPPQVDTGLTIEAPTKAPALPIPKLIQTLQTPHIDQPPDGFAPEITVTPAFNGCGYQWAYKDLPVITESLDKSIKAINPDAKAWATAFGEDCIYADGHADFSAKETDFYVHLTVIDLTDFESFGNWMAQAMQIIEGLPVDMLAGPQPGYVEFWFIKNDTEHVIARVQIQIYRDQATGKSGNELFSLFYIEP